jgi:squalene-associated FAD-dependent desaturase
MSAAQPEPTVAVIGGGWAGLAAAVTLAAAGVPVTVFEAARTLGGRARRVALDGAMLDNGQHLLLGAYRATLALIRQVQPARATEELYARVPLCLTGPGPFRFRAARLPSPLHTLAGLFTARGCTLFDRLAVVRVFARWRRNGWSCAPAQTVAGLLQGQPPTIVARLWTPLCLAALNTPPASASAQVFLNVLRDALAAQRAASDLIIPVTDLSGLFPDPAARYIEEHGGAIHCGAMVRNLAVRDASLVLGLAGATRCFREIVLAAAPWHASELLKGLPFAAGIRAQIAGYRYQPITTVYLRYDRTVPLAFRMLQLGDGPGQWLLDRTAAGAAESLLAVVISADGPHRSLAHAALVRAITGQLRANLPGLDPGAVPAWARVITERRATHACVPERMHPAAGHIGSGVYLAGDHTDPDYPATLEAATRSGVRAAQAVLERR